MEQFAELNAQERLWSVDWYLDLHQGTRTAVCLQLSERQRQSNYGDSPKTTNGNIKYNNSHSVNDSYAAHKVTEMCAIQS